MSERLRLQTFTAAAGAILLTLAIGCDANPTGPSAPDRPEVPAPPASTNAKDSRIRVFD
ncbi:MAG: hypothetical protein AB7I30_16370 [Isosphaeraceae bacterium]